ncbi:GNAT family N-acetyltransferase [Pectobacteriaceae bacterium CE90]|uniref:GNAT family N-acetyltransferase n=1 Tax=Brenneria uluponensis TaxID=3057057 RepID=UPI0025B2E3D4|nr:MULTISPECIES: GNAT family N-acetyltransferase [Pectobacteriaceae]WJV55401.1 GNAT family N-acetyltransferase [Prodigiosinella sp. LS101]WJV59763.1 GNAT family N-acetyltransferase [Pectobacteriaceae bacterium C111]WJY13546.1 GNAT family N-acetyltransferase [Pectobacteriaceae bacterium CE90]
MKIEVVTEATPTVTRLISQLVSQLSTTSATPTLDRIARIVESSATILLVARLEDGAYVGMLTLVLFEIPTGIRAMIEDVVVDVEHRGQGFAEMLTREALRLAQEAGARTVDLTSRPSREAANTLYQKLGFERRESNVYRFSFTPQQ